MNTITITIPATESKYIRAIAPHKYPEDAAERADNQIGEWGGTIDTVNMMVYLLAENKRLKSLMRKKEYSKSIWEGEVASVKLRLSKEQEYVAVLEHKLWFAQKEIQEQDAKIAELKHQKTAITFP